MAKTTRMAKTTEERVLTLLEQILRVLAIQAASERASITDGARMLKLAGLDNQTIAEVLNTTPATVRTLTVNLSPSRWRGGRRTGRR